MLARLIASSTDAPLVISLQSPWGSGKTVFLKRLALHMKGAKGIPTVRIDAWKTDDCADPLVAIIAELSLHLEELRRKDESLSEKVDSCLSRLAKFGSKILLPATSIVADLHTPGSGDVLRSAGAFAERLLDMQKNRSTAEKDFRDALTEARCLVTGRGHDRSPSPMLLMIDELDRCRPDHAIRMLERIKHYFDVPGISFLIASDRGNLPAAVRSVYGIHVDGELYLRKFFDYEFHLRQPNPEIYSSHLVATCINPESKHVLPSEIQLPNGRDFEHAVLAIQSDELGVRVLKGEYMDAFPQFAKTFSLTLRDQEQAVTMITAFIHTRESAMETIPLVDCFLACLRFGHPASFKALVDGSRKILLMEAKDRDDVSQAMIQRLRLLPHWDALQLLAGSAAVPDISSIDDEIDPPTLSERILENYRGPSRSRAKRLPLLFLAARLYGRQFDLFQYSTSFLRLGVN
ncbi:TPA: hypothetical protein QEL58_004110 [Stenotrophomonas maltophilia]|nr:hypothetical protein [Stenotrophomonas maltophilia]HDS1678518.1 hypothetical protein [Stenotrophomonas maltophilia]